MTHRQTVCSRPLLEPLDLAAGSARRLGAALLDVARAIGCWHRRRQTIARLRDLPDRALDDIGLTRGELHALRFTWSRP